MTRELTVSLAVKNVTLPHRLGSEARGELSCLCPFIVGSVLRGLDARVSNNDRLERRPGHKVCYRHVVIIQFMSSTNVASKRQPSHSIVRLFGSQRLRGVFQRVRDKRGVRWLGLRRVRRQFLHEVRFR